jgi:isoleucyl-tRNA synthetase
VKRLFKVYDNNYIADYHEIGIVYIVPGFVEDNYNLHLQNGIFTNDDSIFYPIDNEIHFTSEVSQY